MLLLAAVLTTSAGCNVLPGLLPGPTMSPASPTPPIPPSPTLTAAPTRQLATGVRGLVLAGPTCPVERAGQSACVRAVAGATLLAFDFEGGQVGRAISDAGGQYSIPLRPGRYRIVPQPVAGLLGVAPPADVAVSDGQPVELNFEYDTGIR